jgi:hypothetical protein
MPPLRCPQVQRPVHPVPPTGAFGSPPTPAPAFSSIIPPPQPSPSRPLVPWSTSSSLDYLLASQTATGVSDSRKP